MEDDKLKKLFQNIELDEPGAGFTDNIMKMVEAEEALSLSPALLAFVKNELLAAPSLQFSNNLMANIQPKINKTAAPIITRRGWLVILGIAAAILVLAMIYSHSSLQNLKTNSYFSRLSLNLSGISMTIIKIAGSILPYLIPLCVLLLIDYFFRIGQVQLSAEKRGH